MSLRAALLEVLPDERRVVDGDSVLDQHGRDLSLHAPRRPDVVVFPESTDEVARVLAFASAECVPVVPFGAGTSLEGHVIPVAGGISLSLAQMNRLLALRADELNATVQPGLTRLALNAAAGEHGLFFPVDPGADASLGGMAATNASGTTTVRYGGMRRNVLALEVALADGTVVRTGTRAAKSSAGYDLTSLFVGSEGTLGVVTELTVRLYGIPERVLAVRAAFATLDDACQAAAALVAAGAPVARLELLDGPTLGAVNAYKGTNFAEAPTLFVEVEGEDDDVRELCGAAVTYESDARSDRAVTALGGAPPCPLRAARGRAGQGAQVDRRLRAGARARGLDPPRARRPRRRAASTRRSSRMRATATTTSSSCSTRPTPEERRRAEELNAEMVEWALEHGGTCTGEHGIGMGKLDYLAREHGDLLPLMCGIKRLLDPAGILNPGKVVVE